jgi:hypothetical protein
MFIQSPTVHWAAPPLTPACTKPAGFGDDPLSQSQESAGRPFYMGCP